MDEAVLSDAIHHGFLFKALTLGGEHVGTETDYRRQKDAQTDLSSETNFNDLLKHLSLFLVCLFSR